MKWIRYTIDTIPQAEDVISGILMEHDITNIEIKDNLPVFDEKQGGVYEELQPDISGDLDECKICFYVEEDFDATSLIESIHLSLEETRKFMDIGSGKISVDETDEQDWRNNWKKYFHEFTIEDILFLPTWEDKEGLKDQMVVRIDPGIAFGTGKHETTQLCIRQLKKYLKGGEAVLDLGFGSGILSIVALKLGAGTVAGTDIDEDCILSAKENFENNGLDYEKTSFHIGNLCTDDALEEALGSECYDVVVANILADIIVEMMPRIPGRMKKGGMFISSGIIDFKADEVRSAIEKAGLVVVEVNHQGEWVNITARKEA